MLERRSFTSHLLTLAGRFIALRLEVPLQRVAYLRSTHLQAAGLFKSPALLGLLTVLWNTLSSREAGVAGPEMEAGAALAALQMVRLAEL